MKCNSGSKYLLLGLTLFKKIESYAETNIFIVKMAEEDFGIEKILRAWTRGRESCSAAD